MGLCVPRIIRASREGYTDEVVRQVEEKKVDVNTKDNGTTALHEAVTMGKVDTVKVLLEKLNANCFLQNAEGEMPIHIAVHSGYASIVKLLLSQDEEVSQVKSGIEDKFRGGTLLHSAAHLIIGQKDPVSTMLELLKFDIPIDQVTDDGDRTCLHRRRTALHIAAYYGFKDRCEILVQHGADLTIKDLKGLTAEEVARKSRFHGTNEVAAYLKEQLHRNSKTSNYYYSSN
eukprot:gb/GECH01008693.1/.p1 GENE.gb/GECH01008693.1/~~gb/GECH01008693.1/.p1  ORF type:complete len:230 (+),score=11.89 gb/GECH01008693.1/:1-690(+)